MNLFRRLLAAIAPEMPGDLDLLDGLGRAEAAVPTTLAASSQGGLAAARYGFTTGDGGGRVRCPRCDTWYDLTESHTCPPPPPAAVLAVAFPAHDLVLTGEQADAVIDEIALEDALLVGLTPLMAHSSQIGTRRLAWIESGLRGVA